MFPTPPATDHIEKMTKMTMVKKVTGITKLTTVKKISKMIEMTTSR